MRTNAAKRVTARGRGHNRPGFGQGRDVPARILWSLRDCGGAQFYAAFPGARREDCLHGAGLQSLDEAAGEGVVELAD